MKKKTIFYKSFDDDVIESSNQDYKIKSNYKWIHKNIFYKVVANIVFGVFFVVAKIYYKFILKVKFENKKVLKDYKHKGYFLYGNHTQEIGDAFTLTFLNRRFYVVISQSNLGIPVLGKFLPMLGGLPIPDSLKKMEDFLSAVDTRINENKPVVIYPESHVWPYYTKIRPFDDTSFRFPVKNNSPVFTMTTTYYKKRIGKKPGIKVYIDGPFFADDNLSPKEKQKYLHDKVYDTMLKRSENSNYEYITYKEEKP